MAKDVQTAADRNTIRSAMRQTTGMYKDKAALLAETDALPEGEVFGCIDEGYSYEVAASGATDHDETTAGGDKLYRLYPASIDFDSVAVASAPTATGSATAGNVTGTVYYTVTFVTADGETSGGSLSSSVTVTNKQVDLTNIPVSTDRRVTARKIYRTPNGAADARQGKLLTTISDNTTTTYTDDTLDANLGANVPWSNTTGGYFKDGADKLLGLGGQAVSIGPSAMPNSGYACTAIGPNALADLTIGVRNTAVGHSALANVTTGSTNTGVGVHAGEGSTTGEGNVSVGYSAFQFNTAGTDNVSIGNFAFNVSASGSWNAFIGAQAGQLGAGGADSNVGIGYQALRSVTGDGNTAIGRGAGTAVTSGGFNTAIGYLARAGTGGYFTTVVGANAGASQTTADRNILLGAYAGDKITTQDNQLFIDSFTRTDYATAQASSIIYGVMSSTVADQELHFNAKVHLTASAPSSASDTGTAGEIRVDADYIYVCTATDTWKRVAIATW